MAGFLSHLFLCSLPALSLAPRLTAQRLYSAQIPSGSYYTEPIVVNPVTGKVYLTYTVSSSPIEPGGPFTVACGVIDIDPSTNTSTVIADHEVAETRYIAVNPVTNKIYVSPSSGGVLEIDGATNATALIATEIGGPIAVNPVTNRIYVADESSDAVAAIDGATGAVTEIPTLLSDPGSIAVNPATNRIYVGNGGGVTEIDGDTNIATAIATGTYSGDVAVNPVTNKIYVMQVSNPTVINGPSNLAVIDGASHAVTTVATGSGLYAISAVNPVTNKVYLSSYATNVAVVDGATNSVTTVATGTTTSIAVNAVTDTIFATGIGKVTEIDGATGAMTSIAPGAPGPIAVDPVRNTVYFATASGVESIGEGSSNAPVFATQPIAQTANAGAPLALDALAVPDTGTSYQWFDNGIPLSDAPGVSGSSTANLYLAGGATAADTGIYSCVTTNGEGSTSSNAVPVAVTTASNPGRLVNLSSRGFAGTGNQVLISGFVVSGSGSKQVVLRGDGPALSSFGVTGTLAAPTLSLYDSADPANLMTEDSGWQNPPSAPTGYWAGIVAPAEATAADFSQVGAFGLGAGSADSAISIAVPSGNFTSQVSGENGGTGVALSEVYDADVGSPGTTLSNLSTRAFVGTGGDILIAGFVISGDTSLTVLIRASGPALGAFGLSGTLSDPQLQLFDGNQNLVASNFGWGGSPQISAAGAAAGAFAWNSTASEDSAILITLPPGSYTAQTSGQSGDSGLALIEIYAVPLQGR